MDLTPDQLAEVESFAGLYFTIDEVAEIMGLDTPQVHQAYSDKLSPFYKHYKRGFLISESKVRKCILDLALRNSSPAQEAIKKLSRDTANKNLRYEQ
jgi:hypothetical protein